MIASPNMSPGVPRAARRPTLAAAGALACAAIGLWASLGALAFVGDNDGAAPISNVSNVSSLSYVGLLPAVVWLGLFLLTAALLWILVRPSAGTVAPLWLSAVAILPWLPFRMPLSVFIWTGHTLLWLWVMIVVAIVAIRL